MTQEFRFQTAAIAAVFVFAWGIAARSAEVDGNDVPKAEITALVEQIADDDPKVGRDATEKLLKIGEPAVAPLSKAAEVEDVKVMTRCFDALGRLLVSEDAKTAEATRKALNELSESEIRLVAVRAKTTLRLEKFLRQRQQQGALNQPQLPPAKLGGFPAPIPGAPPAGPQAVPGIQINGKLFGGAANQSMEVSVIEGRRRIKIQNGDEKVEIADTSGNDIQLKHTRPVDGKEKTDEYKADNLDDLKKKHPEAAKLFEKHAGANNAIGPAAGGIQIQVQAGAPVIPFRFQSELVPTSPNRPSGPRTIRANLEGRKIEITDDDGEKIRVKTTTLVDGKEVSQEISADDLATLKAEHPDAAKLYQQLTGRKAD